MERLLHKEYSKTEIDDMSPEVFTSASRKCRRDLMVRHAFLLGFENPKSVPIADVHKFVMGHLRRSQEVQMGMVDALGARKRM